MDNGSAIVGYGKGDSLRTAQLVALSLAERGRVYVMPEPSPLAFTVFAMRKLLCRTGCYVDNGKAVFIKADGSIEERHCKPTETANPAADYRKRLSDGDIVPIERTVTDSYIHEITVGHKLARPLKVIFNANNGVGFRLVPYALTLIGADVIPVKEKAFLSDKTTSTDNAERETKLSDNTFNECLPDGTQSNSVTVEKEAVLTETHLNENLLDGTQSNSVTVEKEAVLTEAHLNENLPDGTQSNQVALDREAILANATPDNDLPDGENGDLYLEVDEDCERVRLAVWQDEWRFLTDAQTECAFARFALKGVPSTRKRFIVDGCSKELDGLLAECDVEAVTVKGMRITHRDALHAAGGAKGKRFMPSTCADGVAGAVALVMQAETERN